MLRLDNGTERLQNLILKRRYKLIQTTQLHWASYAIYLAEIGRFDIAIEEIRKARQLDPLSLIIYAQVGSILYLARQYKEALNHFRQGFGLEEEFPLAHFILGYILEALGAYDEAIMEYQRSQTGLGNRAEFIACVGRINA